MAPMKRTFSQAYAAAVAAGKAEAAKIDDFKAIVDAQPAEPSDPDDGHLRWEEFGWRYTPGADEIRAHQLHTMKKVWVEVARRKAKRQRMWPTLSFLKAPASGRHELEKRASGGQRGAQRRVRQRLFAKTWRRWRRVRQRLFHVVDMHDAGGDAEDELEHHYLAYQDDKTAVSMMHIEDPRTQHVVGLEGYWWDFGVAVCVPGNDAPNLLQKALL